MPDEAERGGNASRTRSWIVRERCLADVFVGRSNSLGFLRWLFAAMVVVDHSFPLGGFHHGVDPTWGWTRGQDSLGGIAVAGFFIISGFLVSRSWFTSGNAGRFIWRRFLRIFPAFWICLVVTATLFAALAWRHEHGGIAGVFSVHHESPVHYVTSNFWLQMNQYNIAGLLTRTPLSKTGYPIGWDGSLWTLIYEFKCYLLLAVLGFAGLLRRRIVVVVLTILAYLATISWQINPAWAAKLLPILIDPFVARFSFLFFLGVLITLYADRIIIDDRLGVLALIVATLTLHNGGWLALGYFAFAYATIWLAIRLPLAWFERAGDFSYGTYIWAFPLQMLLAEYGLYRHGETIFIFASLAVATGAAALSWHLVEKRALRLKDLKWSAISPRQRREQTSVSTPDLTAPGNEPMPVGR